MHSLGMLDAIGFLAAALTLATFAQTRLPQMRSTAIAANLCFISYGLLGGFLPIVILHVLLLPINLVRLWELRNAAPPIAEHAGDEALPGPPAAAPVWDAGPRGAAS